MVIEATIMILLARLFYLFLGNCYNLDVRQEITPKASWGPMYALAAMAYVGAIVAFATIYTAETRKTYTDTIIVSTDQTGQDGYTCQMISKVTADYEIASQNDPSLAFELVNVIESRGQYESNYAIADPCSQPMTFFPGDLYNMFPGQIVEYGAVAMYGSDVAMITMGSDEYQVLSLEYSTGVLYTFSAEDQLVTSSVAVGPGAVTFYVTKRSDDTGGAVYVVNSMDYLTEAHSAIYTSPYLTPPKVLNDNLYNIYLLDGNTTFSALDLHPSGGGNATASVIFTVPLGQVVQYAAVYTDASTGATTIYYSTQNEEIFVWEGGLITPVRNQTNLAGLAVDGTNGLFCAVYDSIYGNLYVYNSDLELVVETSTNDGSPPTGFAVTVAGDRAAFLLPTVVSSLISFATPLDGTNLGHNDGVVEVRRGDAAGYFTCGDQLLNDTQFSIGSSSAYPTVCRNNGVVGKVVFEGARWQAYMDAIDYVMTNAAPYCAALYDPIGDVIADLPPYSCSRTIHPSFLSCLATAAANAQVLFQILVFFSAALLTRLAPRFPPKRATPIARPEPPPSIELADLSGNGPEKTSDNPMANKSSGYHP